MDAMKISLIFVVFLSVAQRSGGDVVVSLGLTHFTDVGGEDIGGECCDGVCVWGICTCPTKCDLYFYICVEPIHFGSPNSGECNSGWKKTGVIQANADEVSLQLGRTYGTFSNPTTFTDKNPTWEGFYLKMKVMDEDDVNQDDDVDLFVAEFRPPAYVAGKKYFLTYTHNRKNIDPTKSQIQFSIQCTPGFHGPDCSQITTTSSTSSTSTTSATTQTTATTSTSVTTATTATSTTSVTTGTTATTTTSVTTATSSTTTSATTATTSTSSTSATTTTTSVTSTTSRTTSTSATTSTSSSTSTSTTSATTTTTTPPDSCLTCADYFSMGQQTNGVYDLKVFKSGVSHNFKAYCDMESDGGGWTVFQKRNNDNTNFIRDWADYKNGFGDFTSFLGSYWLGNDKINLLTECTETSLMVVLQDCTGITSFETYKSFWVENEARNYMLHVSEGGDASGSAGNSLSYPGRLNQNGMNFSTFDQDHDTISIKCTDYFPGGCGGSNLNGRYYKDCFYSSVLPDGIYWYTWKPGRYSAQQVAMKIRPLNFS